MEHENADLEYTGERHMPGHGDLRTAFEHVHRYLLATALARGKSVLDISCGEGYGTQLLSGVAAHTIGVDVDPGTVRHANEQYGAENIAFVVGDAERIPLQSECVDLVVSFETLEHVPDAVAFLAEIRRVVKPDGLVIISTPNKAVYSDEANYSNPFHIKEFYVDELTQVLEGHFARVTMLGQRILGTSTIWPLGQAVKSTRFLADPTPDSGERPAGSPTIAPEYVVAICSGEAKRLSSASELSFYLDAANGLIREYEQRGGRLTEIATLRDQVAALSDAAKNEAATRQRNDDLAAELAFVQENARRLSGEQAQTAAALDDALQDAARQTADHAEALAELEMARRQGAQQSGEQAQTIAALDETRARLAALETAWAGSQAENEALATQLLAVRTELARERSSLGFKVVGRMRTAAVGLFPPTTGRGRAYATLLGWVTRTASHRWPAKH